MGNKSYCRFRHTLEDLDDCYEHLDDDVGEVEQEARRRLIGLCVRIANEAGELADED